MKYLVKLCLVLCLLPLGLYGQSAEKPQYAPGREKHRNKTDEIGQKQGVWKYFNSGGEIIHEIEYVNDVRHGMSKRFYPYGKTMEETEYQNGVKEGAFIRYYYSGSVKQEGEYLEGKKNGKWTKYFESGEVQSETPYKNGNRDGDWKVFNRKGTLVSQVTYKDGVDVAAAAASKAEEDKKAAAKKKEQAAKAGTAVTPGAIPPPGTGTAPSAAPAQIPATTPATTPPPPATTPPPPQRQLQRNNFMDAYIIAGFRSPVGKAPKGKFRFLRADDLAATVVKHLVSSIPSLDKHQIEDVIVGNATPEAEQGLNIGRMISLMGLDTIKVPGMTVNRYCSSGLETIAIAASKINAGLADCIVAGGVETMSPIPFGGWRIVPNYEVAKTHPDWYWGMGLTAEAVAREYKVSREDQDLFSLSSHQKAINAIQNGFFKDGMVPIAIEETYLDESEKKKTRNLVVDTDEGPRADTNLEKLATLKPVFDARGSVTAGNSSQTSDGAAFVLVVSEKMLKQLNVQPIARFVTYAVAAVEPRIMGIGPVEAIPMALKRAGMKQEQIDLIELNEAFASQALAVIRELQLNPEIVNVNGGAIALGHPLGCTGAKLTVQVLDELKRRKKKYGMVTMCVGTGQGAAGIFELLN